MPDFAPRKIAKANSDKKNNKEAYFYIEILLKLTKRRMSMSMDEMIIRKGGKVPIKSFRMRDKLSYADMRNKCVSLLLNRIVSSFCISKFHLSGDHSLLYKEQELQKFQNRVDLVQNDPSVP
ncbi:unnamed protein product [Phytomonas sp. EM1]|nr:unnamed protein product [Phytomonas sp. EM1]|eukprot:CCW59583.1 unnamed protein product [Phytomonas sp. isolate EM1]